MVVVKILGKEEFNGKVLWLKKLVMYNREPRGDRVVLERYDLTKIVKNGMAPWDDHGECFGLDQEEAVILYKLSDERL